LRTPGMLRMEAQREDWIGGAAKAKIGVIEA
jgi:hypothetical protein